VIQQTDRNDWATECSGLVSLLCWRLSSVTRSRSSHAGEQYAAILSAAFRVSSVRPSVCNSKTESRSKTKAKKNKVR